MESAIPESWATVALWGLSNSSASRTHQCIQIHTGCSTSWPNAAPQSQTAHFTLLSIKAQMDIPHKRGWRIPQEGKGHLETERYSRDQRHKKGSILISREEQGMVSSNLVITSGWRTPSFPMLWPRAKISAHRPGKNAEPETERERKSIFLLGDKSQ